MTNNIDQVRLALSRILKIKLNHIGQWRIECGQDAYRAIGVSSSHFPGMLEASLKVYFAYNEDVISKLEELRTNSSVACNDFTMEERGFDIIIQANMFLLYGKETQHVFKALAQMFIYRKPQSHKRNRK